MIYYIWSLVISLILFIIIQFYENEKCKKNNEPYNVFTTNNFIIFFIIYLLSTILFYYLFTSYPNIINLIPIKSFSFSSSEINTNNDDIDKNILKRIPDIYETGFEPPINSNE